ncbi:MAG: IS200/IS605 family transposase [Bacteroidetes bacterium]|nr:IS200/IS605 family transposase [Bacteroidota bacterium]MBS1978653.1 IS200/IS605 family transposase [Bacteroidota bacterium]
MANTYSQIFVHIVFTVKYRKALLDLSWRSTVFGVIANLVKEANCKPLIVNGTADHVHCLVGLKPAVSVSDLMRVVKAKSSKYINDRGLTGARFEWQEGYGVFSHAYSQVKTVYNYIKNQESHHQKRHFREEYRSFLTDNGIDYDEKYLFIDPQE